MNNNCLCHIFDDNCTWIIILAIIVAIVALVMAIKSFWVSKTISTILSIFEFHSHCFT